MSVPRVDVRTGAVLAVAALIGAWQGYLRAAWQDCVEPAQVLAGIVTYDDPGNPFYIYQTKVATILHPLCAAALHLGLDERAASTLVSVLMAIVFYVAIASWTWGLTESSALALSVTPILAVVDTTNWGLRYPLNLVVTSASYGAFGLALALLACGLIVCRRRFAGGFVAGLTPSVHAVLGIWALVVLGLATAWRREGLSRRDPLLRGAMTGLGASATFFFVHFAAAPARPPIDAEAAARYLRLFAGAGWHQGPIDFDWPPVFFVLAALALAAGWLGAFRARLAEAEQLALRIVVTAIAVGLALAAGHTLLGEHSPRLLIMTMPCRLLNLAVLAGFLTLVSLAWTARPARLSRVAVVVLLGTAVVVRLRGVADVEAWCLLGATFGCLALLGGAGAVGSPREASGMLAAAGLPLLLLAANGAAHGRWIVASLTVATAAGLAMRARFGNATVADRAPVSSRRAHTIAAAALLGLGAWCAARAAGQPRLQLRDRHDDPVLARAAAGRGLLLVGCEMNPVQVLVRRPLLIDPEQIDMLPYAIEGAPAARRIDEEIYGGAMLSDAPIACRETWQRRTSVEWREIARRFGVTEAITLGDWRLQLPPLARNDRYALYALPGADGISGARASDR